MRQCVGMQTYMIWILDRLILQPCYAAYMDGLCGLQHLNWDICGTFMPVSNLLKSSIYVLKTNPSSCIHLGESLWLVNYIFSDSSLFFKCSLLRFYKDSNTGHTPKHAGWLKNMSLSISKVAFLPSAADLCCSPCILEVFFLGCVQIQGLHPPKTEFVSHLCYGATSEAVQMWRLFRCSPKNASSCFSWMKGQVV